jgi:hypothetical protein
LVKSDQQTFLVQDKVEGKAHRCVDAVISFHIGVLPGSVVGFSEGDAWHAAGNGTCIDGHEAAKEGLVPWAGIRCSRTSDDRGVGKSLVEAFDPVVYIVLVDDGLLSCSWSWSGFCHSVWVFEVDEMISKE